MAEGVRPPLQDRSRRTLERIVQAALEIVETEGLEGLTVQRVVRRARSSVGSFYARFGGKNDLVHFLTERAWQEASQRWVAALEGDDWRSLDLDALVDGSVTLLAETVRSGGALLRALGPGGAGGGAYQRFRAQLVEGLAGMLLGRRGEILHSDPEVAVRVGLLAVLGVLEGAAGDAGGAVDAPQAREEAALLLRSYLRPGRAGNATPLGQVDFFDIWG